MKRLVKLLTFTVIIAFVILISRETYLHSAMNHVSGAWTTLAVDLTHGTFYRPMLDESIGYGGTRFFPLHFVIHAAFIKLTGSPVWSGHIVSLLCTIATALILFLILNLKGDRKHNSLIYLMFFLLSTTTLQGVLSIRGDLLPLALNLAGIFLLIKKGSQKISGKVLLTSALLFALAFSAKVTAVYSLFSVLLWFIIKKRYRDAVSIFTVTSLLYGAVLISVIAISEGRIMNIFRECASGGANLISIIIGPLRMLNSARHHDWPSLFIFAAALFCFIKVVRKREFTFPLLFWIVSVGYISFLFGSPGVVYNHWVLLTASSVWLIAESGEIKELAEKWGPPKFTATLLLVALTIFQFNNQAIPTSHAYYDNVTSAYREKENVFVEDPMLHFLAGAETPPFMADAFMLCIKYRNSTPEKQNEILSLFQEQKFDRLILLRNPVTYPEWYDFHISNELINEIIEDYQFTKKVEHWSVWDRKEGRE